MSKYFTDSLGQNRCTRRINRAKSAPDCMPATRQQIQTDRVGGRETKTRDEAKMRDRGERKQGRDREKKVGGKREERWMERKEVDEEKVEREGRGRGGGGREG